MSEIHDLERDLEVAIGADRLELLNKAARALQHTHPSGAYDYAQEALALAGNEGDLLGMATSQLELGPLYQ